MRSAMKGLGVALLATAATGQFVDVITRHNDSADVFAVYNGRIVRKTWENGVWSPASLSGDLPADQSDIMATASAPTTWCEICIGTFFVCAADGNVYERYFRHGKWNPDEQHGCLGDNISGPPEGASHVAAECAPDIIGYDNMVARGFNGGYYTKWADGGDDWAPGGSTGDWVPLGGNWRGPAAVKWVGQPEFHVFGVDAVTGSVGHKMLHFNTTNWEPAGEDWDKLGGGPFKGDIAATSPGPGRYDVWAIGEDGALWHKSWVKGTFSDWESLGGTNLVGPPRVWSDHTGGFAIIVAQDKGDGTYGYKIKSYDPEPKEWAPSKTGFFDEQGSFISAPGLTSWTFGTVSFFGITPAGTLVYRGLTTTGWDPAVGWKDLVDLNTVAVAEAPKLQYQELR